MSERIDHPAAEGRLPLRQRIAQACRHRVAPLLYPHVAAAATATGPARLGRALAWSLMVLLLAVAVVWPLLPAAQVQALQAAVGRAPPAAVAASVPAATGGSAVQLQPGTRFRDCPDDTLCPWLRVLPSGSFLMGSPKDEQGRRDSEDPHHRVSIAKPFAAMEAEVTRGQFKRFVQETGYVVKGGCFTLKAGNWEDDANSDWSKPGFPQTDDHPVVCVNWNDAQVYAKWLSGKTNQSYRLLTEAEWENAARAGTQTSWSFGEDESSLCASANVADQSAKRVLGDATKGWTLVTCDDGHGYTAPSKTYKPNAWGLHDMHGNAWEWVADCWHDNYQNAPTDGSEWRSGCGKEDRRVLRGGGWYSGPQGSRSAIRSYIAPDGRNGNAGFRLARTLLAPKAEGPLPTATQASK